MRISDWSSDVCSSDLGPTASAESTLPAMSQASTGVFAGILTGASTLQPIGQSATAIVGMLATASSRLGRMSQASIAEFEAILTGAGELGAIVQAALAKADFVATASGTLQSLNQHLIGWVTGGAKINVTANRSGERRVGKSRGSTCSSRWGRT